jgi:hypothetical protein
MSGTARRRPCPRARATAARDSCVRAAGTLLLGAILATATAGPLAAQASTPAAPAVSVPLVATRFSAPIRLDGRVDEAAWLAIESLPAVMHSPTFGTEPTERTEFRIAYDAEFLYISGIFHYRDPADVRVTTLMRDEVTSSSDWLGVTIDGYRDRENALMFAVNPGGVRTDVEWPNDGETRYNTAWNAFWDAEVARTDTGWSAEIRIPFTSLPYQPDEGGEVVMGITVWRQVGRRFERMSWPAIEPLWTFALGKASQTGDVVFHGLSRQRVMYATPYLLAGGDRAPILPVGAGRWGTASTGVAEAGLDVKVGLTANLTLDMTVNTDFAQVEADDQEVNLTRFSLFFPERRLFFQERAGIFAFETGDSDRLFYSRRIGLVDGQPARIYGGARIVGRIGEWDVGALNMHTAAADDATRNVGTLRLRRRLHNANSYAGGMLTTLIGGDGRHNVAAGLDMTLNLSGQNFLSVNLAHTWSDEDASLDPAERGLGRIRFERRGLDGLAVDAGASRVGSRYDPALGFLQRRDFTRIGDGVAWGWRASAGSPVLRHRLALKGRAFLRNDGFELETLEVGPEWTLDMKSSRQWTASTTLRQESVTRQFAFSGASVPAGEYQWVEARVAYMQPYSNLLRGTVTVESGRFYDGARIGFSVAPTWTISRHLELRGLYQASRITFDERPAGQEQATVQVARLRARAMFTNALSTAFMVQYTSAAELVTLNARLRYNRREGQDFYLVFNDRLNTERADLEPSLPLSAGRTLLLKYSHAMPFGW